MTEALEQFDVVRVIDKPESLLFLLRGECDIGDPVVAKANIRRALDEAGLERVKFAVFQGMDVVAISIEEVRGLEARAK